MIKRAEFIRKQKMCQRGEIVKMKLPVGGVVDIDKCLAPVVKVLNDGGVVTVGCCCGHGRIAGYIHLKDDRYFRIFPNRISFMKHSHERL